jgi:hypothetical protein
MGGLHNVVLAARRVRRVFIPAVKDQWRLCQELVAVAAGVERAMEDPGWV